MRCAVMLGASAICVVSMMPAGHAQQRRPFPALDAHVLAPPSPFAIGGQTQLVYELQITNLSARDMTLQAVDVLDASAEDAAPLVHLEGALLEHALQWFGPQPGSVAGRVARGGQSGIIFVWAAVTERTTPSVLTHRFTVDVSGERLTISGVNVSVAQRQPRVIGAPLRGDHWLAANGPANESAHRRALLALSGQVRIAQRFAIDWVRLYEDGRTLHGDPLVNRNYRAYGADVLAVSDGVVRGIQDGLSENTPDPVERAVPMTPETLGGNYVVLDIGRGAYAFYAHLQPRSIRVKTGDTVRRGQVLAQVGNSGNSSEPHLHFHIADRATALDADGQPYVFDEYAVELQSDEARSTIVPIGNSLGVEPVALTKWLQTRPRRQARGLPILNVIVKFSD